jgi:hypothetical protein
MSKEDKTEKVINNIDLDTNSIDSDNDEEQDIMGNLKNMLSQMAKPKKKKSKKKAKEDDTDSDDVDVNVNEEDDDNDDDSEDDDDDSDDDDSEDDDDEYDGTTMALSALFQETFYDSEGVSIAESLSKIATVLDKIYNLEKKKYSKT